jgi:uncharacterized protein
MRRHLYLKLLTILLLNFITFSVFLGTPILANGQVINLSMGSTSSTSGVYAFAVAIASAVNKYDPEMVVTVVESGASFDNAKRMKEGIFDWSSSGSPAVYTQVRDGIGSFEREGAWEPIRLMFLRDMNITRIYIREDIAEKEGIKTFSDLTGKRFYPGMPGTRDMDRIIAADELFKVGINFIPGSVSDAVRALQEGRIVGMAKGSPANNLDAAMMEVHFKTPVTVIGFSEEQTQRLQEADPLETFINTPAGLIKEIPEHDSLWEMNSSVMTMSSSNMSQEIGYRIMKAVHRGWEEIALSYPSCKDVHPIEDAFRAIPEGREGYYFHAGVIQYAKEIGIDVPEHIIPPEYEG